MNNSCRLLQFSDSYLVDGYEGEREGGEGESHIFDLFVNEDNAYGL